MTTQQVRREAMKWQRAGYPARVVIRRGEKHLDVRLPHERRAGLMTVAASRRTRMPLRATAAQEG
jgi:hypothetical protein